MARIEIYSKAFCSYCTRAKQLLAAKGVDFEEYDITMGDPHPAFSSGSSRPSRSSA